MLKAQNKHSWQKKLYKNTFPYIPATAGFHFMAQVILYNIYQLVTSNAKNLPAGIFLSASFLHSGLKETVLSLLAQKKFPALRMPSAHRA